MNASNLISEQIGLFKQNLDNLNKLNHDGKLTPDTAEVMKIALDSQVNSIFMLVRAMVSDDK